MLAGSGAASAIASVLVTALIVIGSVIGVVVAYEASAWVAARIWWIGATLAVCFAPAIAASIWLERRADRRGAEWGAERHGASTRAPTWCCRTPQRAAAVSAGPERPAVAAPGITVNIFGVPSPEQAAVIRQALPGEASAHESLRLVTRNSGVAGSGAGTLA